MTTPFCRTVMPPSSKMTSPSWLAQAVELLPPEPFIPPVLADGEPAEAGSPPVPPASGCIVPPEPVPPPEPVIPLLGSVVDSAPWSQPPTRFRVQKGLPQQHV